MKLFVIPKGTKVALGNGDGILKTFVTTKEFAFSDFITDPIYYYNQKRIDNFLELAILQGDPTIKAKHDTVAKYDLRTLDDGVNYEYKYLYANYGDVKVL